MTVYKAADISKWGDKVKRRMKAVVQESTQRVFAEAQTPVAKGGNMPVDTGFLRNSLTMALNGSTSLTGPESYVLSVAGMDLGDIIEGGWTANYARHVEHGSRGRAGRKFMNSAANNWTRIVDQVAKEVQDMP